MRAAGAVSPDTVGRIAHILSAQKLWLERILKQRQSMPVWPGSTIEDCLVLADEIVGMAVDSLAQIFALPAERLRGMLVASRAIDWGNDPFARGAYSYATPRTRDALARLRQPAAGVFFSGEALYAGPEMGTVEAALSSGLETARTILS